MKGIGVVVQTSLLRTKFALDKIKPKNIKNVLTKICLVWTTLLIEDFTYSLDYDYSFIVILEYTSFIMRLK